MEWGVDEQPLAEHEVDFADPDAPDALFRLLADGGAISAMVLCHTESVDSDIQQHDDRELRSSLRGERPERAGS